MPKNRHLTFGDMQAQKAREEHLAKMRAMLKPAEAATGELEQPAPAEPVAKPAASKPEPKPAAAKQAPAKKAAAKPAPKKAVAKKKGKR